ncbi:MAG: hypothetical protein U1E13_09585 [Methylophilaceae bacterium]|nr:hypothetical protein [Methylophilaceae bacterium]
MIRALLLSILLSSLLAVLASCEKQEKERSGVGVKQFMSDVHVEIAGQSLILPFIALEDYAKVPQSFYLGRKGDREHTLNAVNKFLRDASDPKNPLVFDSLTVVVDTYGWNDFDINQRQVCPLLTREWARSVCDNPWAAIQQALPLNRFRLVDLRLLLMDDPRRPGQCFNNGKPHRPLPQSPGEAVMICESSDYDGNKRRFHSAVVRIDGDLGALWTVWQSEKNDETAEAMTEREGKAIVTFVQNALGKSEDFPALHATMCNLRRPGSVDSPKGADCGLAALPSLNLNQ